MKLDDQSAVHGNVMKLRLLIAILLPDSQPATAQVDLAMPGKPGIGPTSVVTNTNGRRRVDDKYELLLCFDDLQ